MLGDRVRGKRLMQAIKERTQANADNSDPELKLSDN